MFTTCCSESVAPNAVRSRAMALASLKGSLTLYALKSMSELKREVEHNGNLYGDRFEPVREVSEPGATA